MLSMGYMTNCVFIDRSGSNANLTRSQALIARVNLVSNLISTSKKKWKNSLKESTFFSSKKKKLADEKIFSTNGTSTHTSAAIKPIIEDCEYKCVSLYSKLNHIEQFWSVVKSSAEERTYVRERHFNSIGI
ncbi:hypothetical protein A0J61_09493 [Choanephora cucurbitarum]|uniref:Uncharacterized protein n=1 Tax=Choanephora cucurbitarum TaxID=101091 RepID=A0A1C7N1F5_9FUNG|nr:hypothetical protein A0J61_09493 [Choanephora cucurbitarum]